MAAKKPRAKKAAPPIVKDEPHPIMALPSGERVHVHPDGSLHLIHEDHVLKRIAALSDSVHESQRQLHAEHLERVERKLAKQQAKGLPPEKSPL